MKKNDFLKKLDKGDSNTEKLIDKLENTIEKMHNIIDAIPDAIFILNKDGIIQSINQEALSLFGYNEDELIEKNINILMPESLQSNHNSYIKKHFKNGDPRQLKRIRLVEAKHKDGSSIPVSIRINSGSSNNEIFFIGVIHDLTEEMAILKKMHHTKEMFSKLFEKSPDTHFIIDFNDLKIVECNTTAEQTFRTTRHNIIGLTPQDIMPNILPNGKTAEEDVKVNFENILKEGYHRFESFHQRHDGEIFPCDVTVSLVHLDSQTMGLVNLKDTSKSYMQSQHLSNSLEELEVINQLLSSPLPNNYTDLLRFMKNNLKKVLKINWLNIMSIGGIFLVDDQELELVVSENLAPKIQERCKRIKKGECLCGKAFEKKELIYASQINQDHDITYEGMEPHGHYNIPIKHKDEVLGMMVFYIPAEHTKNQREIRVLTSISEVFARMIIHYKQEKEKFGLLDILEKSPDCISQIDIEGRFLYMNQSFKSTLGVEDYKGRDFRFAHNPKQIDIIKNEVFPNLSKQASYQKNVGYLNKDKIAVPCSLSAICHEDEKGNATHYTGIFHNITKIKEYEKKLKASNLQYDLAIQGVGVGIWDWIDVNDVILVCSDRYYQLLGYEPKEIPFDIPTLTAFIHPDDLEHSELNLKHCFEKKQLLRSEYRLKNKNGKYRWYRISGKAKFDVDGNPQRLVGSIEDIHEHKVSEERLIKARKKAEHAEQAKTMFLANMSHEIRTPLNGILGMSHLLQDTQQEEENKDKIETIIKSSNSLLTIVNDILDFSKIEAGKLEMENINFDLYMLMEDILKVFQNQATKKGITISKLINRNTTQWVYSDYYRIKQILNNIISNAIKFTVRGNVNFSVALKNEINDEITLEFKVQDTGIGIDKVDQKKLFKDFSQIDNSTTRRFGGTGLGLSISKQLIENLGGKIKVTSKLGEGTEFTFTIVSKKGIEQLPQLISSQTKNHDMQDLKILVVDDNIVNQKVLKGHMRKYKAQIDTASNGAECLKKLEQIHYDLIFMDCHMPVMDGFEATQKIIELYGDKRPIIVALTASTMKEDIDRCYASGMDNFLAKPLKGELLQSILYCYF